jgi:hypothetical protein
MGIREAQNRESQARFASAFRVAVPLIAFLVATTLDAQQAGAVLQVTHTRIVYGDLQKMKGPRDSAWRLCQGAAQASRMPDAANLNQMAQTHRELGFQSELGNTELAHSDSSSWITFDSRGVQALIWNEPAPMHPVSGGAQVAATPAQFRLEHLVPGDYTLELFRTRCGSGEAFTLKPEPSFQAAFNAQQLADLRKTTVVAPTLRRTVTIDPRGFFSIEIPLSQNELVLALLSKEAK